MTAKRLMSLLLPLLCLTLACSLLTTPATQAPAIQGPPINVETSVAGTRAFEFAVQTAAAGQVPPTPQGFAATAQPPAATAEPTAGSPLISASVDTNCRKGPATIYEAISYLLVGNTSEVVAKYQNGLWWVIKDPNNPNQRCWVWGQTTSVTGNWQQLPDATQPPTPTGSVILTMHGGVLVDTSPDPDNYTGPCPVVAKLFWGVESNMAVTIGYMLLPGVGAVESYTFAGPGLKEWSYGTDITHSGTFWERLEIVSPVSMYKEVTYTVTCTP